MYKKSQNIILCFKCSHVILKFSGIYFTRYITQHTDEGMYYLGQWDDGAMKTGWQKIYVTDNEDDDEEKEFWFNFKSNGIKRRADPADGTTGNITEKTINGKKYGFDYRGVMTYEWTLATTNTSVAAQSTASSWKYFRSPEDGARVTKGWFKVVAPEEDNDNVFYSYEEGVSFAISDAEDETERWYYADGDGELYAGKIKKIKGKYYGFRPDDGKGKDAAMLTGLVLMQTDGDNIVNVLDDDVDADDLDEFISDGTYTDDLGTHTIPYDATLYYFGNDEDHDGAMKTGNVNINLDGENYNFKFSKSGGAEGKGRGITGLDDKKYVYKYGLKLKASNDDKYQVVYVTGDTASSNAQVAKIDAQELRDYARENSYILTDSAGNNITNKDGDSVTSFGKKNQVWEHKFKLLTTSGTVVKSKTAARDGADWYFYVDNEHIIMYNNTKTLTANSKSKKGDADYEALNNGLNTWKKWNDVDTVGLFTDAVNVKSWSSMNEVKDEEEVVE